MNRLAENLQRISADLGDLEVRWAVVGGLAVSVWGEPRLTRDIDLAVPANTDADAERLLRDLGVRGYRTFELVEHEAAGRLATARVSAGAQPNGIVIDLLFASSGIEAEIVADCVRIEVFPSVFACVATRPHLIAMKLLARDDRIRPQDFDDLRSLLATATADDMETVRRLLALITERGFARRRDLVARLDDVIREIGT